MTLTPEKISELRALADALTQARGNHHYLASHITAASIDALTAQQQEIAALTSERDGLREALRGPRPRRAEEWMMLLAK